MAIVPLQAAKASSRLEAYRQQLGLTLEEAAELTGVSRRQLRRLEFDPRFTPAGLRIALMYVGLDVLAGNAGLFVGNGAGAA